MEGNDHTKTKARLRRHQQSKAKDQQQERSKLYLGDSSSRAVKTTLRKESTTTHLHKVAPVINVQRRNSTKPLEELGKIQHLGQI